MRNLLALPFLSAGLVLGAVDVFAHAALKGSTPAMGGVAPADGFPVELRFNGRVDAARSRMVLTLADGSRRKLAAMPGSTPSSVTAKAEAVPPGTCSLRYDVLSNDGHLTSGTITFSAAPR